MKDMDVLERTPQTEAAEHQIQFGSNRHLQSFSGPLGKNLSLISDALRVEIRQRDCGLTFTSTPALLAAALPRIRALQLLVESGRDITEQDICGEELISTGDEASFVTRKKVVTGRTDGQKLFCSLLKAKQLSFGVGPAGTGKTYIAVACGVSMLISGQVERLIFSRPAVEAGEKLGFLPGDMKEKVDPYMQPIYDALRDFIPEKQIAKHIEDKVIEIAPLAFMRGRTLSGAFVLLDEAQNATAMQMKMFLTRLGRGSHMVITGDPDQTDLPRGITSGLNEALRILDGVDGIGVARMNASDVVRHPLVAKILAAWDAEK